MKIFDCFQYFNESHIADLRFHILDKYVDFFVIVESTVNHQGEAKELSFDIRNYSKFKDKIIYIVVDDTPESIKIPHEGGESLVEQHQRNSILRGLKNCDDNDLVILSDVDEIPDLDKLNLFNKKNYAVFSQRMFMYKINLLNLDEKNWHGSKICLKKNFKSPQWLRNLKFKKYPFWRLDKLRNIQIINDGGWHFAYLQSPQDISKKIKSFAHGEYNKEHIVNEDKIKLKLEKGEDILERGYRIKKIDIDNTFPQYIVDNKNKLKQWIV
jgi:beta-1,4-mannosyl-glycoprotein beta-1,4-N-acetylglucosaminyltransferase|tara:strand:+ start:14606 stop:15412 length:807 start_codon:yes stop_codon:yes gene_type:complete